MPATEYFDVLPAVDEIRQLTVRDIMTTDVITVPPTMPVTDLLGLLVDQHVGGVPVVGDDGVAVGVVSATDVLRLAIYTADIAPYEAPAFDVESDGTRARFLDDRSLQNLAEREGQEALAGWVVADIMTPIAFSVTPDASLAELARVLFEERIHRALVTSEGSLLGIATSFDIVRAVAATQA